MCFKPSLSFRFPSPLCHVNFRCELRVGPNYDFRLPAMVVIHRTRSARLFTRSFRENSKSTGVVQRGPRTEFITLIIGNDRV
ncbi:hypothetical protein ACFX12_011109 [Malus domestica]